MFQCAGTTSAQQYLISRRVSGDIGNCSVGITPQICNRVTNHGDLGTFSKPDSPFDATILALNAAIPMLEQAPVSLLGAVILAPGGLQGLATNYNDTGIDDSDAEIGNNTAGIGDNAVKVIPC